ncbi:MAG: dienelactone hydrolase family protein [Oligoflexus sp.]
MCRRGFAAAITGIILTFAGSAQAKIQTKNIQYQHENTKMRGFLAYDDSIKGPRAAVIVVHEWWGQNDYARQRARQLAELGYAAFAIDMYGDGKSTEHPKEAGAFAQAALANLDEAEQRFQAAMNVLTELEQVDQKKIAAIGYCFGGGVVLHMARRGLPLKGVVSFHGSLSSQKRAEPGEVKAQVLVLHGEEDHMISSQSIADLAVEMTLAAPSFEFIAYPGAAHSFTNPAADEIAKKFDMPVAYHQEADQQSWQKMQEFLTRVFAQTSH